MPKSQMAVSDAWSHTPHPMLWIPHNLNNSLRTVNIDFNIFLDFMEFPNISTNNLKLFDVNVIWRWR